MSVPEKKLSFQQKMLISLVSISPGVINSLVVNSMLIYYTDKLGMGNEALYGVAILIFGVWNAINNPIIGVYVENWTPKSGKEKLKSMMKIGLPFMFLGFLVFTLAPKGSADWVLFIFLLVGLILFELGKAIVEVASLTFSLMIVTEPKQRSSLILVMKILEFIPLALVGIVPVIFLAPDRPYWQALIFILAVCTVMFLFSYWAIFRIEEPDDLFQKIQVPNSPDDDLVVEKEKKAGSSWRLMIDSIKSTLGSKPFVMLILFRFFGAFFQGSFAANITFMINWVVPLSSGILKLLVLGTGGVIINLYYIIQTNLLKKMSMVKVIYLSFLVSAIGYLLLFFANGFGMLIISYCLSNMGLAAIYMFSNVMMGDIGDDHFVKTGKRRYSEFTANFSVFNSLAPAFTSFIITLILQFSNYNGDSDTGQQDSAIWGIKIIASILPILGLIICTIILRFYPLQGKKYFEMRRKFDEITK